MATLLQCMHSHGAKAQAGIACCSACLLKHAPKCTARSLNRLSGQHTLRLLRSACDTHDEMAGDSNRNPRDNLAIAMMTAPAAFRLHVHDVQSTQLGSIVAMPHPQVVLAARNATACLP